jgi:hypothetical protein
MTRIYFIQYILSVIPRGFDIIKMGITSTFLNLNIQTDIPGLQNIGEIKKQEVLGRIEDVQQFVYCCICIYCHGKVSTEQ